MDFFTRVVSDPQTAGRIILEFGARKDPFAHDAVRIARITNPDSSRITVYQTSSDPPNFWRLANDSSEARLYDAATGAITRLRRALNDAPGKWYIIDTAGRSAGAVIVANKTVSMSTGTMPLPAAPAFANDVEGPIPDRGPYLPNSNFRESGMNHETLVRLAREGRTSNPPRGSA